MNKWDRLAEIIVELVGPTNPEQREELHRESHGLLRTLRERHEKLQRDYGKCFCMLENVTADWGQEEIEALGQLDVARPIAEKKR